MLPMMILKLRQCSTRLRHPFPYTCHGCGVTSLNKQWIESVASHKNLGRSVTSYSKIVQLRHNANRSGWHCQWQMQALAWTLSTFSFTSLSTPRKLVLMSLAKSLPLL